MRKGQPSLRYRCSGWTPVEISSLSIKETPWDIKKRLIECGQHLGVLVTVFTGEGMSKYIGAVYWEEATEGPYVSLLPLYQPAVNTFKLRGSYYPLPETRKEGNGQSARSSNID